MTGANFDLAIGGGGIDGAGIASDAAGRGRKDLPVEQGDLGWPPRRAPPSGSMAASAIWSTARSDGGRRRFSLPEKRPARFGSGGPG